MTPGTYNLNLYRGDTYTWAFRLWQDVERTIPVVLTSSSVAAQIRNKPLPEGTTVMNLVAELDDTDVNENTILVSIPVVAWASIPTLLAGYWDLQVTSPGGTEVQTVVKGKVKITGDVTAVVAPT